MENNRFDGKKIDLPEEEWKKRLSPTEYKILREKGTDRSLANEYYTTKDKGTYYCRGCHLALFSSDDKYDSGSGWPSFTKKIHEENISSSKDLSHNMDRTEIHCSRCGGHLGHVFNDGPAPSYRRYCVNSTSLKFEKTKS